MYASQKIKKITTLRINYYYPTTIKFTQKVLKFIHSKIYKDFLILN
jgi:hypothetical protein